MACIKCAGVPGVATAKGAGKPHPLYSLRMSTNFCLAESSKYGSSTCIEHIISFERKVCGDITMPHRAAPRFHTRSDHPFG